MSIKSKLILSAVIAAFSMGTAFAADAPAADASAPVKAEKKAPKKAHKKAPKKAAKADASAPAAK